MFRNLGIVIINVAPTLISRCLGIPGRGVAGVGEWRGLPEYRQQQSDHPTSTTRNLCPGGGGSRHRCQDARAGS